jgi:2,3,4,5-tetrahydropyridine-2-carboxylate N-succinyltransferase
MTAETVVAPSAPVSESASAPSPSAAIDPATVLADLEAGRLRAAEPDPTAPDGWRIRPEVKAAILACFADRTTVDSAAGPLLFRDRAAVPPRDDLAGGPWRIVPGGTAVRRGAHLGEGVVVMPPSYVNVGAWVGPDSMVDSHVLVGSCAQIGARVHLAAGVTIGGVLEPPGARPVIVEDDAFVGAGSALLEGVLIGRGAVIAAGVTLTGTSRLYDLVRDRVLEGATGAPLAVPPGAVVVPGSRALDGALAIQHGLSVSVALLVKDRDAGTSARVALEDALR